MIIFFVIIAVVSAMVTIGVVIHINAHKKKKIESKQKPKQIEAKDERYWSEVQESADGFYNLVKDSLPRDLGLIYELEVTKHKTESDYYYSIGELRNGEEIVVVKVFDPIRDKFIGILKLSERVEWYKSSSGRVTEFKEETLPGKIKHFVREEEKKELIGRKEIVA